MISGIKRTSIAIGCTVLTGISLGANGLLVSRGRLDAEVGVEVAVLRPNHESTEKATESAVERCFGEIVFSKSMLTDHTPSSYAAAISRL